MADTPPPADGSGENPPRRYWIDDDGNVHGIVLTVEVDPKNVFEFTGKAINYPPGTRREDLKG
jgi:hypothetical protein